jgi:aminoglycoside phosphotransferase (APT) family kinase protein
MVSGASAEARWVRPEPRRTVSAATLEAMVHAAFPRCRVAGIEPMIGGLRNANFKVHLFSSPEPVVLRIYEHDVSLCQKEVDVIGLVSGSAPVPEVIYAEPRGFEDVPPFAWMRYVEGISFRELKHSGDRDAIAQAAYSAGETLAAIGRATFPLPGWLAAGPAVTAPLREGADSTLRFVDLCLASAKLRRRMPADLRERTHALVWKWAPQFAALDEEACLVHGDFNKRNVLVREVAGKWRVAAVLDWEFATAGSPLSDLGTFLRYERASRPVAEPHFSNGYSQAGGKLNASWRQCARLLDLAALCESLTHPQLPAAVVEELVELTRATLEGREPEFPTSHSGAARKLH